MNFDSKDNKLRKKIAQIDIRVFVPSFSLVWTKENSYVLGRNNKY